MNIWIDAQLPPTLAVWLTSTFAVNATALRDLGLRDAQDAEIFNARHTAKTPRRLLCERLRQRVASRREEFIECV